VGEVDPGAEDQGVVRPGPAPTEQVDLAATTLARTLGATAPGGTGPGRSRSRGRAGRAGVSSSGAGPDARDPQPVGVGVEQFLVDRGWQVSAVGATLVSRWPEIVGAEVAGHVACETFTPGAAGAGGELVLRADSTAWATQTRLLLASLHARVNEAVGPGVVTRIRVLGPAAPTRSPGRLRVPGRGPRDTYG
jgi:predicted nucleic acid-binding Zn ribbon protein